MLFLAIPYPNIDPVALPLGPVSIKWYVLAYMAVLPLGWLYLRQLLARPGLWPQGSAPFAQRDTDDLLIYVAVGVLLGGRLGHVLFYDPLYYLQNPLNIVAVWRGGMAFHGGLIGSIVAI